MMKNFFSNLFDKFFGDNRPEAKTDETPATVAPEKPVEENPPPVAPSPIAEVKPEIDKRIFELRDIHGFDFQMRPKKDSPAQTKQEILKELAEVACEFRSTLKKESGIVAPKLGVNKAVFVSNRMINVAAVFSFKDFDGGKFGAGLCRHEEERLKNLDKVLKSFLN